MLGGWREFGPDAVLGNPETLIVQQPSTVG